MRLRRPSPSIVIATAALVLAAGGFAVAAIPSRDGTIHACYKTEGGDVRVVKGTTCKQGERALSWNRGVAGVVVRTRTLTIQPSKCTGSGQFELCQGTGALTVPCRAGERATGGGFGQSKTGTSASPTESRPSPAAGKPTGWTVAAVATRSGGSNPAARLPIYAVCAN